MALRQLRRYASAFWRIAQSRGDERAAWPLYPLSAVVATLLGVTLFSAGVREPLISTAVPFLVTVLLIALLWGRGPAIVAALTASAVFNFFFVPPFDARFDLPTAEEVILLAGMLSVAFGLGTAVNQLGATRAAARELEASERLQRILLGCVSHDLKTPLTGVIGSLSTLLDKHSALDGRARDELLTIAYREARQLDRVVTQVLEMSRLEAGAVRVREEPTELAGLIRGALGHLREALDGRPCRVEVAPGIPLVSVDSVVFPHALINILENAARYSPPGTPIEVTASAGPEGVVICVADRGIGIPIEHLDRVFDKFHRVRQPTPAAGRTDGTGLGLAIAKGIVEAHGGRVWAEQRDGGGTIIKVDLPLRGRGDG